MNERYKKYYTALIGKLSADQFLKRFQGKADHNKYTSIKTENDKYWILNTTKVICSKQRGFFENKEFLQIDGSLYYSLYMNKNKDMVVLKAPLMGFSLGSTSRTNADNNIRYYLGAILKKLGFTKFEFNLANKAQYGKSITYMTCPMKILIPNNKTEDDLANLMLIIDKLNDYISSHPYGYWEDAIAIKKHIKFDYNDPTKSFKDDDEDDGWYTV
jgi:hypothetical protein